MASNSVLDASEIYRSIDSISKTVSSYSNSLNNLKKSVNTINEEYKALVHARGDNQGWLGNVTTFDDWNPNNPGGVGYRIIWDDKFVAFNGGDGITGLVSEFNKAYDNFCDVARSLESTLEEARGEVQQAELEQVKMEESLAAAFGSGISSGVGGGYSGGDYSGGGSGLGSLLSSNPVKFNEKSASDTGLNNSDFFNKDRSIQSATAATAAHDSIIDSLNKSKDERFNSTHNSNLTNHSSNGSNYSTRNGTHSGGGFSSSRGYSSLNSGTGADEKKGLLSSVVTSVDDIIRSSKKKGLASSSIPILGSDKVTGSSVVPIASSIGAAGASGIGLASFFGKKKDDEDDDDDDEKADIDVADYDGNEQNLEDNTNLIKKSIVDLDDIDASMNAKTDKESFATTDLIETDAANRVVDSEKNEENLYI